MASSIEPSGKRPTSGTRRVRRRGAYYDLEEILGEVSVIAGGWMLILWLLGGAVALFFGAAGGQWGWGFGFAWYLPLLAALVVTIAVVGVSMSFLVFSVVRSNE